MPDADATEAELGARAEVMPYINTRDNRPHLQERSRYPCVRDQMLIVLLVYKYEPLGQYLSIYSISRDACMLNVAVLPCESQKNARIRPSEMWRRRRVPSHRDRHDGNQFPSISSESTI
jgi:hypothetical protein